MRARTAANAAPAAWARPRCRSGGVARDGLEGRGRAGFDDELPAARVRVRAGRHVCRSRQDRRWRVRAGQGHGGGVERRQLLRPQAPKVEAGAASSHRRRGDAPRARNMILLLGDGMGMAHRTAARARLARRRATARRVAPLAMDTLEVTGPGDDLVAERGRSPTRRPACRPTPRDRRATTTRKASTRTTRPIPSTTRASSTSASCCGACAAPGFNVGIVTTADVTDATPGANAVHTANRSAGPGIAARFFDERARNGVLGADGRRRAQLPAEGQPGGAARRRARLLGAEFVAAGYRTDRTAPSCRRCSTRRRRRARAARPVPAAAHVGRLRQGRRRAATARSWRCRRTRPCAISRCSTR